MADEKGFSVNDPEHLEEALKGVSYGIYDTQGDCWLGDDTGPKLFSRKDSADVNGMPPEIMAKIAAMMAGVQLGYEPDRLVAREFAEENLRLKDSVPTKMTPLEALIKLESGGAKV